MYKQHLLNNIEKEINICCRLYTKLPPGKMDFRPGEGVRSIAELLQYLAVAGTLMLDYWLKEDNADFGTYYGTAIAASKTKFPEQFLTAMDEQLISIRRTFFRLNENDLFNKEITYPWSGVKAPLGEAIIATSIKWLAAYKLQLFSFSKLVGNQQLTTADAWMLTELSS